jgi:RND family efflux transporter MFP subunit
MKHPLLTILRSVRPAGLGVLLALPAALFLLASCAKRTETTLPPDVDYFTCTMHPSVKTRNPKDKCPICSMDLVPVKKKPATSTAPAEAQKGHDHARIQSEPPPSSKPGAPSHAGHAGHGQPPPSGPVVSDAPTEFVVPVARQQQIGVTYATVEQRPLQQTVRTVGAVAYDKQRHWDYVSRVEGYVQKLHVFARGELVEKDQPLLTLYSPELLTTQREFVDLLRMRDTAEASGSPAAVQSAERLLDSARVRLRLWNIDEHQIKELEQSRKARETLTLHSPFKGVVQDLAVDQGRRVMAGDHLVDLADLSVVWVWAEFYQEEIPFLKKGLPVAITTSARPGETFTGRIAIVDPFINDARRTARVRLDIENPDLKLRPDMYVDVELELDFGQGLTLPVTAAMPTGKRNVVFVDKGEGRLEPRFVELGRKFGERYQVKAGVTNGERVVNSANFLIDAEAKVQGALKSW